MSDAHWVVVIASLGMGGFSFLAFLAGARKALVEAAEAEAEAEEEAQRQAEEELLGAEMGIPEVAGA